MQRQGGSKKQSGGSQVTPSRVEPKVYFANERTFLSWTHTGILLAGLSLTILGKNLLNIKIFVIMLYKRKWY